MGKDVNKVLLTGHLGQDPEMRYTAQGSAVTSFRVAAGRTWKSADGTQHEETEWFRIVAWEKLGEICNQYLTKGTRVYIEGRLQTRKWQDKDGQDRYTTEVIASDMIILSSKRDGASAEAQEDGEPEYQAPASTPASPPARPPARAPAAEAPAQRPAGVRPSSATAAARNRRPPSDDEDLPF